MGKNIPDEYFKKLQNNQLTDADKKAFADWMLYADPASVETIIEKISSYYKDQQDEQFIPLILGQAIEQRIDISQKHKVRALIKRGLTVAAAVAGIAFTYYTFKSKPVTNTIAITRHTTIIPGGNKAILILGNGKSILLDAEKDGLLANQGNMKIVKAGNGRVIYSGVNQNAPGNNTLVFNTLTTPRGGQYQVELPDGTKVWLNAVSSLRYPVNFGSGDRRVELTGEAYFEVAKDKAHPFKVSVNNMEVKVLGTHFNIMAYADEVSTKTTLLEGSVQVFKGTNQRTIVPGEQAIVGEDIQVKKVKISEAVEWKNGNFNFAHEQLPVIMRKIARWYDIDITYEGKPTTLKFVGTLPRSKNISEVLKYLELTGLVNFKVSERRVIVMP